MPWMAPTLQVQWGAYFKADPDEEQKVVATVQLALGSTPGSTPIITRRMGVEKIAKIYGIENVESALEAIEKEADERAQRELDAATAQIAAKAGAAGPGANAGGKPAGPPGNSRRPPSGKDDAKPAGKGAGS